MILGSVLSLIVGVVQLPFSLLGGKLADRFNKRNLIIVCDLVTVACYIACSLMEIGMTAIVVFCVGGVFATLEWPSKPGGPDRLGGAFMEPEGSGLVSLIEETTSALPPYEVSARASKTPPAR